MYAAPTVTDWTTDAADAIERTVTLVRDRTVVPVQGAARYVIYALIGVLVIVPAVMLLSIAIFRIVVVYTGEAYIAWFVLSGTFLLAGAFFWVKHNP